MKSHTFHFATQQNDSWVSDVNGSIVGVTADSGWVVSTDPSLTSLTFQDLANNFQLDGLLIIANSANFNSLFPLNFPISVGERIYCATDQTPVTVQLFIESIPS